MSSRDYVAAALYLRRSTDMQDASLNDQEQALTVHARAISAEIVKKYVDDAVSGTSTKGRKQFTQMIRDAKEGLFDRLLCYDLSRFSRGGTEETGYYLHMLKQAGVKVEFVAEQMPEGDEGELLLGVKAWQAKQYSVKLSRDSIRGQISYVQKNDPGRALYGYDREYRTAEGQFIHRIRHLPDGIKEIRNESNKVLRHVSKRGRIGKQDKSDIVVLVPGDPKHVKVVQEIFDLCLKGYGYVKIADHLNQRGIPGPTGGTWGRTTIKSVLENEAYMGTVVWNKRTEAKFHSIKRTGAAAGTAQRKSRSGAVLDNPKDDWYIAHGRHESLVTREQWEAVQRAIASRNKNQGAARKHKNRFLLSGLISCGHCGGRFNGHNHHKGKVKRKDGSFRKGIVTGKYVCNGHKNRGKTVCPTSAVINAKALETVVLDAVSQVFIDGERQNEIIDRLVKSVRDNRTAGTDVAAIDKQIADIDKTVAAITSNIDPENIALLNDKLTELRKERDRLRQERLQAVQANGEVLDTRTLKKLARGFISRLSELLAGQLSMESARRMLAKVVDSITIDPAQKSGVLNLRPWAFAAIDNATPAVMAGVAPRRGRGDKI